MLSPCFKVGGRFTRATGQVSRDLARLCWTSEGKYAAVANSAVLSGTASWELVSSGFLHHAWHWAHGLANLDRPMQPPRGTRPEGACPFEGSKVELLIEGEVFAIALCIGVCDNGLYARVDVSEVVWDPYKNVCLPRWD